MVQLSCPAGTHAAEGRRPSPGFLSSPSDRFPGLDQRSRDVTSLERGRFPQATPSRRRTAAERTSARVHRRALAAWQGLAHAEATLTHCVLVQVSHHRPRLPPERQGASATREVAAVDRSKHMLPGTRPGTHPPRSLVAHRGTRVRR